MTATTTDPAPQVRLLAEIQAEQGATRPERLGVHLQGDGADVVVYAPRATRMQLCLLTDDGADALAERRVDLLPKSHGRWHAHIPGIAAGQRYGLRAHGPWDPAHGMRHNPAKLLLDPYARGISGSLTLRQEVCSADDDGAADPGDSAPFVPLGVVIDDAYDGEVDHRPRTTWSKTVIYEAHVRGLTMRLPGVPEHLRGTYAGLAHPVTIKHLRDLGVTAVELLPIHASLSEPALAERGMVNYWGYNTLGFFAPEARYATEAAQAAGPAAVLHEVKGMVELLHRAGLEVILDVVYNHTCEGGPEGPMLSWRGLDEAGYYVHNDGDCRVYEDYTGTGNALDFRNPRVVQMALDSLRYWSAQVGVDGFRFDLAVTLGRSGAQFHTDHPFLVALATDPELSGRKLIAEPWDLGPDGWRTGQFPAPMTEWNDRFRDSVRTFWLSDVGANANGAAGHDLRDLATRLAGSADMFAHTAIPGGRGPIASVNYVTAHDGLTLADLVSYDVKHNEDNGEDGQDGSDDNRSWNHGTEGPTGDEVILAARRRSMRNLLGTLVVAGGTPMITAGDEIARTQHGNNNAYCLDDERVWVDWDTSAHARSQLATLRHLLRLRRDNSVLRPWQYRTYTPAGRPTLAWDDEGGAPMTLDTWHDPHRRVLQLARCAASPDGGRSVLVVINGAVNPVRATLPTAEDERYELAWSSEWEDPADGPAQAPLQAGSQVDLSPICMRIYLSA